MHVLSTGLELTGIRVDVMGISKEVVGSSEAVVGTDVPSFPSSAV